MRTTIGAVVFRKGCLLLVRKEQTWILPGGKPEVDESHIQTLVREFSEELPEARITTVTKYLGSFIGKTPHVGDQIKTHVYKVEIEGQITPSAEIKESAWVPLLTARDLNLANPTRQVVDALFQKGLA